MKKIIFVNWIILLSLLLIGCKTHTHYQYKLVDTVVIKDTIELPPIHYHYTNDKKEKFCAWVESSQVEFVDTVNINIIETVYCKSKIHKKNINRKL